MARIPTTDPVKPQGIGSTGVQTDINMGSDVFRSIAGVENVLKKKQAQKSAELERLEKEAQASIDRGAKHAASRQNMSVDRVLMDSINEAGVQNDPQKWKDVINGTVSKIDEDYYKAIDGVSPEVAEQLRIDRDFYVAEAKSKLIGQAALQIEKNENTQGLLLAEEYARRGLLDSAFFTVDGLSVPDAEKMKLKDSVAGAAAAGIKSEIDLAETVEETDEITSYAEQIGLTGSRLASIKKAAESQKRSLNSRAYSRLSSELSLQSGIVSRIERGDFFTEEEIMALPVDGDTKELIRKSGQELRGGLNQYTTEFDDFSAMIDSEFESDPFGPVGSGEVSAEKYAEIYSKIDSSDFDTSARFALITKLMQMRAVDSSIDSDLYGSLRPVETKDGTTIRLDGQEISIDDAQSKALKDASLQMSSVLGRSGGRISAVKTGMTFSDYSSLFLKFQSPEFIQKFEGLDPDSKEYQDLYKQAVTDEIAKKKSRTSVQLLRDRMLSLSSQKLQVRQ